MKTAKGRAIERVGEGKLDVQASLSANLEIRMGLDEMLSKVLTVSCSGNLLVKDPLRLVVNTDHHPPLPHDNHNLVASTYGSLR